MNLFLGEWVERRFPLQLSSWIPGERNNGDKEVHQSYAFSAISRVLMPMDKTASVLCKEDLYCCIAQTDHEASNDHPL